MARNNRTNASSRSQTDNKSSPNRPAHDIRMGRIRAVLWENEGESGTWYNVRISRLYKDGDQWRDADSFSRDDLPLIAEVSRQAWQWIYEQAQAS